LTCKVIEICFHGVIPLVKREKLLADVESGKVINSIIDITEVEVRSDGTIIQLFGVHVDVIALKTIEVVKPNHDGHYADKESA
jgi:hypothetical protein